MTDNLSTPSAIPPTPRRQECHLGFKMREGVLSGIPDPSKRHNARQNVRICLHEWQVVLEPLSEGVGHKRNIREGWAWVASTIFDLLNESSLGA